MYLCVCVPTKTIDQIQRRGGFQNYLEVLFAKSRKSLWGCRIIIKCSEIVSLSWTTMSDENQISLVISRNGFMLMWNCFHSHVVGQLFYSWSISKFPGWCWSLHSLTISRVFPKIICLPGLDSKMTLVTYSMRSLIDNAPHYWFFLKQCARNLTIHTLNFPLSLGSFFNY